MENKRRTYGYETMLEITPVKMNLSSDFKNSGTILGEIHSEFERVNNYIFSLCNEKRMLTVMKSGNTLLPDSIILEKDNYETLKKQENHSVCISNNCLFVGNVKIPFIENSNCSLLTLNADNFNKDDFEKLKKEIIEFSKTSEKKSYFEKIPVKYKEKLGDFANSLVSGNWDLMLSSLSAILGAGKGLTPSADDAVIGVLAGWTLKLSLENNVKMYLEKTNLIAPLLNNEKITTAVSLKYLKSALKGNFSQDLCALIKILSKEKCEDVSKPLQRIRDIGASSGMDMLYGLNTMLEKISC